MALIKSVFRKSRNTFRAKYEYLKENKIPKLHIIEKMRNNFFLNGEMD